VAEAVAVAAPKPTTWIGKRLPWLAAAKPGTGHEWVLYAINFFMLYQGITVWRGWQLSPARNFMVRFQQSSVNRFFHNRSLRQIQRAAAKELAASAASRGGAQAPKTLGYVRRMRASEASWRARRAGERGERAGERSELLGERSEREREASTKKTTCPRTCRRKGRRGARRRARSRAIGSRSCARSRKEDDLSADMSQKGSEGGAKKSWIQGHRLTLLCSLAQRRRPVCGGSGSQELEGVRVPVCGGSGSQDVLEGMRGRTCAPPLMAPHPPLRPARLHMAPHPPAAGEVAHVLGRTCARPHMCSAAHVLGRTCARPHMCSCARPHLCSAAHVLGRTCARPHMCSAAHVLGRTCARLQGTSLYTLKS
jgi:hypothetical protein